MNAQGYDSDAQCIGTPKHVGNVNGSFRSPAFRQMGMSDLIERSREANSLERWASASGQDQSNIPGASFGMHSVPTPTGSMRDRLAARYVKHANGSTGGHSTPFFNPPFANQRSGEQNTFAKSLPSIHVSHEESVPPNRDNPHTHGMLGSSDVNLQNQVVGWAQYMDSNRAEYGAASFGTLPRQSPEIVIPKRHHPAGYSSTHSEARPPYLSDLDLSHRVTESNKTSGPPSNNSSMTNIPRANRYGLRMLSQGDIPSSDTSGTSAVVESESQKQAMLHKRDVSSFYSRQSNEGSGRASPAIHSLRVHAANVMQRLPNIHGRMAGEVAFIEDGQGPADEVVKNKFVDQLKNAKSDANQPHAACNLASCLESQRKVSPGWMTDGRRMGYGYNLVDNVEETDSNEHKNDNLISSQPWVNQVSEQTPAVHEHGTDESAQQRTKIETPNQPVTLKGGSKGLDSRWSPAKTPTDHNGDPILKPSMWAKMKSPSTQLHSEAPLVADLVGQGVFPANDHCSNSVHEQYGQSPTRASVDYVEDNDVNILSRWSKGNPSIRKQPQADKNDELRLGRNSCTPETSPIAGRRSSIDHTNRRPSVYFDPANGGSADRLNGQPSGSRSGRWILRFSRNRESIKRSNKLRREPSQDSWIPCEESAHIGLERANSTRSDMAADLANEYQECIQMPGAFYGSRWASRTSLVVEAE
jgi:hypothetical protein